MGIYGNSLTFDDGGGEGPAVSEVGKKRFRFSVVEMPEAQNALRPTFGDQRSFQAGEHFERRARKAAFVKSLGRSSLLEDVAEGEEKEEEEAA